MLKAFSPNKAYFLPQKQNKKKNSSSNTNTRKLPLDMTDNNTNVSKVIMFQKRAKEAYTHKYST